jgi:hypothetical protein
MTAVSVTVLPAAAILPANISNLVMVGAADTLYGIKVTTHPSAVSIVKTERTESCSSAEACLAGPAIRRGLAVKGGGGSTNSPSRSISPRRTSLARTPPALLSCTEARTSIEWPPTKPS